MTMQHAATRIYACALLAFPSGHRASYAAEMVDTFERELGAHVREHGRWRAMRFIIAAWLNVVSEGLGERRRNRRARQAPAGRGAIGAVGRDLIHAVRSLAKARAFTFVCVTSLGVGMGTVIAILLLVRAIIGTPRGVDADGLVELLVRPLGPLRAQTGGRDIETWSYPDYVDVRDAETGMAISAWTFGETRLQSRDGGGVARIPTMYVSPNYFTTVGVALARGRGFDERGKDVPADDPTVVVGFRLWQNRLGADLQIIGSTITLNRATHIVVGVAPDGYRGHLSPEGSPDVELWLPLDTHPRLQTGDPDSFRHNRDADWLRLLGRLSPETNLPRANGALASIVSGLAARYPTTHQFKTGLVEPYHPLGARSRREAQIAQATFFGLSGLVLFIVCLNISGMVLVRSATRERELAVRLAIGASRGRLMQYLLSEAFVLSILGGALAAAVLFGVPSALLWWFDVWHPDLDLFKPDAWVYVQCVGLCLVTSLVFGLLPAIRFSRPSLVSALKDDAGGGGRRVGRAHRLTAAIQAGIAVPFLVIAGVKLDQVRTTAAADFGFEHKGLFAAPLSLSADGRVDIKKDAPFLLRRAKEQLEQATGVTSVSMADGVPLDFRSRITRVARERDATRVQAHTTRVAERYFDTMGIPLVRGRGFTRDDRPGAALVVVLSEPLAAQLFPDGDALGKRLTFALEGTAHPALTAVNRQTFALEGTAEQVFTVVGVTADLVTSQMGTPRPQMFVPLAQHPAPRVVLIARAAAADAAMASAFKNAVADLDPDFAPASLTTGDRLVRRSVIDLTTHSAVAVICAGVALTLAALGVYGVVGFMVATRRREIGLRMALGASRPRVLGTVLADAVKVVMPGVVVGLVLAVVLVRVANVAESWYALGGVEPLAYAAAAAIAMVVALVAGLPSARGAARVDPIQAMRAE